MSAMPRRRKAVFAMVAALAAAGIVILVFVAADVYVHWRTQDVGGVNVWGYRGGPIGSKRPGETRVVMLGGSTVFGWGLPAHESIPAFLERRLTADGGRYSVVNLGAPGQGAYGFVFDLADFSYLAYDIVCLYEGYNDLAPTTPRGTNNFLLWRRESPIFLATGYLPLLPIVMREKAEAIMNGGRVAAAPGEVRFDAGIARRAAAGALEAAADLTSGLSTSPGILPDAPSNPAVDEECIPAWRRYCGSVRDAVAWALERDKRVIFVTQPYISEEHVEQQANVAAMLAARFGADSRFTHVNLGQAIDLRDRTIAYDGLHLVAAGNDTIAANLVEPIRAATR